MYPQLDFNKAFMVYIDNAVNNNLSNLGYIDKNVDCTELILSILYKFKNIYYSQQTSDDIKEKILNLYNKLIFPKL